MAISAPNLYQSFACFKVANRIGAVVTFLNPLEAYAEELKYLKLYRAKLLINYGKDDTYNKEIIKGSGVRHVISIDPARVNQREFDDAAAYTEDGAVISYHALRIVAARYGGKPLRTVFGGKRDALILYTSGSTGEPKCLLFTNENIIAAAIYYRGSAHLQKLTDENRRWMGIVPFMYPYGICASVISPLLARREIILAPGLSPGSISYYYGKKPYLIFGSPVFLELTKRNLPEEQDLSGLRVFVSGGDFLSVSQSHAARDYFAAHHADVAMCNSSGNGEVLGCCTNAMGVGYRPETVGKLVVGPDYLVIGPETRQEVKYGEHGVLCTRGKHVFKGYYNCPERRDEVMIDVKGKRYYYTGNYGSLGEDGYFTMIGRASRFYITNTLNKVYCELVQAVLSKIDVVESVAVVAKPDKSALYTSKAYVVLKGGGAPDKKTELYIISASRKPLIDPSTSEETVLKDYEIPQSVSFLDALPRTAADKIDYALLQGMAQAEYEREQAAQ